MKAGKSEIIKVTSKVHPKGTGFLLAFPISPRPLCQVRVAPSHVELGCAGCAVKTDLEPRSYIGATHTKDTKDPKDKGLHTLKTLPIKTAGP